MLDDTEQAAEPPRAETLEEKRVRRYYEAQQRRKEIRVIREAEKKAKKEQDRLKQQQDADYPKLTPEEWKRKYGSDKPKIGLIDEQTAVRVVSRRMTAMALHTLAAVCEMSKNDGARVAAAKEILDRGWGKAHLAPEGETRPGSEITVVFGDAKMLDKATAPTPISPDYDDPDDASGPED